MAAWLLLSAAFVWQPPSAPASAPAFESATGVVPVANADADVLVVCPEAFRGALRPWVEYRASQGRRIAFADDASSGEAIRREIKSRHNAGALKTVLIVGDVPQLPAPPAIGPEVPGASRSGRDAFAEKPGVPTFVIPAKINVRFGSTPEIATDLPYADVDDDGIPDLSIGRWPVASPEEVAVYVRRSIAYERRQSEGTLDDSAWQREIDVVCGVGGFGWLADKLLEDVTKKLLVEEIPSEYDVRVTYANWRSPYCPDPRAFGETVCDRIESGPLFWVYVGHGQRRSLDRLRVERDTFPILDVQRCDFQGDGPGRTIAVLLACFAGAYDDPQGCLAESMLNDPEGPVAVIASSRVAMPYAMSVLARGMMHQRFAEGEETLGEMFLAAKRGMSEPVDQPDETRRLMDTLARALSPHRDELQAELDEHQALFHLLGDPLLRLPRRETFALDAPESAKPGATIAISTDVLADDVCRLELVSRRDGSRHELPYRGDDAFAADWSRWTRLHELANDKSWGMCDLLVDRPAGTIDFEVPADARGECYLRCTIRRGEKIVSAATPIRIEP